MTKTTTHRAVQSLRNELELLDFVAVYKTWQNIKCHGGDRNATLIREADGSITFEFEALEIGAWYVGWYGRQTVSHAGAGRFRVTVSRKPGRFCGLTNYTLPMAP